jgi:hypothetical protein
MTIRVYYIVRWLTGCLDALVQNWCYALSRIVLLFCAQRDNEQNDRRALKMAACLGPECSTHKTPDAVFVRPRQARLLQRGPARIVTLTLREMEVIVTRLSGCGSKAEFDELRTKIFPDYIHLSYILANTFSLPEGSTVRQAVIQQSIKNVAHVIKTLGTPLMSPETVRDAIFCIETLGRAYRLVNLIHSHEDVRSDRIEKDRELARQFSSVAIWSQLHLDCLRFIVSHKLVVGEEILKEILEGMRLSVLAYSFARQGLELRTVREPILTDIILDEEDHELLNESFLECESSINDEP